MRPTCAVQGCDTVDGLRAFYVLEGAVEGSLGRWCPAHLIDGVDVAMAVVTRAGDVVVIGAPSRWATVTAIR